MNNLLYDTGMDVIGEQINLQGKNVDHFDNKYINLFCGQQRTIGTHLFKAWHAVHYSCFHEGRVLL